MVGEVVVTAWLYALVGSQVRDGAIRAERGDWLLETLNLVLVTARLAEAMPK